MKAPRLYRSAAAIALAALALTACSSTTSDEAASGETTTVTVEDNFGSQTVTVPAASVVATDNTTFETLSAWGVPLKAGAVALMPDTISYKQDSSIVDLGTHREPNLEAIVAADPDLIVNGNRFAQFREDFRKLARTPPSSTSPPARTSRWMPNSSAAPPSSARSSTSRPRRSSSTTSSMHPSPG